MNLVDQRAGQGFGRSVTSSAQRDTFVYERVSPLGSFGLRRLLNPEDITTLHAWVSLPYARYWGLEGRSITEVATAYTEIAQSADVYLGFYEGRPAFLVECYHPTEHAVGSHYAAQPGDRGMHVLTAPPDRPIPGFTWAVFSFVMDFLFSDPEATRVVVEPDIRNAKIHKLNRKAGFRYQKVIELPNKVAHLAVCTRAQYRAACDTGSGANVDPMTERNDSELIAHLQPAVWAEANRALIRKAIAELAHERLLHLNLLRASGEWGEYELAADAAGTRYRFRARVLELNHWDIDASSIEKLAGAERIALDAVEFVIDVRSRLAIDDATLPVYLEEITSTLWASAYKRAHQAWTAADLVHAEFQEIESAMAEGHPAFIANSGRVGFDAADFIRYAPDAAPSVELVWLAADRRHTEVSTAADLTYERLLHEELGTETLESFHRQVRDRGVDPASYLFIPVHPWQWFNKLAMIFAADVAAGDLICLGYGKDQYRPQQSIRTFFNTTHPQRRYVKTALSVLNMGFMRGLSADYMRVTPAINDWIDGVIQADRFFSERRFGILREVAGIGYRNPCFEAAVPKASPYRKMLAALWRESPLPKLGAGQRVLTMAALLHRDRDGAALLPQLILASGKSVDEWLDCYLGCYLVPLLHCFYRYDVAFMPHGENVILILEDYLPVGVFLKDIAEEVAVMGDTWMLPHDVQRIRVSVPEELKALSIFTDIFDGFLRFMAHILLEQASYPQERFWYRVAECASRYRRERPELAPKMDRYDLFAPEFLHSCLNRLQLRNNRQMIDLTDPAKNLAFAGTLKNPIARYRRDGPA